MNPKPRHRCKTIHAWCTVGDDHAKRKGQPEGGSYVAYSGDDGHANRKRNSSRIRQEWDSGESSGMRKPEWSDSDRGYLGYLDEEQGTYSQSKSLRKNVREDRGDVQGTYSQSKPFWKRRNDSDQGSDSDGGGYRGDVQGTYSQTQPLRKKVREDGYANRKRMLIRQPESDGDRDQGSDSDGGGYRGDVQGTYSQLFPSWKRRKKEKRKKTSEMADSDSDEGSDDQTNKSTIDQSQPHDPTPPPGSPSSPDRAHANGSTPSNQADSTQARPTTRRTGTHVHRPHFPDAPPPVANVPVDRLPGSPASGDAAGTRTRPPHGPDAPPSS